MFLSNLRRTFLLFALIVPVLQACVDQQTNTNKDFPAIDGERSSFSFSVKEPLVYSGEIVQISGSVTTAYFVARNGDKSRIDFDRGGANQLSRVHNDGDFVVSYKTKTYYEMPSGSGEVAGLSPADTLTRGFLGGIEPAKFEKLESQNGQTKFRVNYMPEGKSETFIYFDEVVKMPVRQEFFAIDGEKRTIMFSVEFKDLKLEADDSLFAVPTGFRKTDAPN